MPDGNTAAQRFSIESDLTRPGVTISGVPSVITALFTATITFSEDVTGFELADITVTGGTSSDLTSVSGRSYTIVVTPVAEGTLSLSVPANVAEDASGNGNAPSPISSGSSDLTDPDVTLTGTAAFPGTPYALTVTFSEAVTGLALADFVTTNVMLSDLSGSGTTFTVQALASDFDQSVQLPANTVADASGRGNTASNTFSVTPDASAPVLSITGMPDQFQAGAVFDVTFAFSEDVTGFDATDVAVTHGTLGGFSGGPSVFFATMRPDGDNDVTVSVAEVPRPTSLACHRWPHPQEPQSTARPLPAKRSQAS
ncbi:Ig-like domain-containing protein [Aestuariibius sp. 2305UL40-4]|uniref:Ig-like domain-containing protein n=1 Tax=Aestuariibius violaceus TaxID=3234132 RepID=UPI00345E5B34